MSSIPQPARGEEVPVQGHHLLAEQDTHEGRFLDTSGYLPPRQDAYHVTAFMLQPVSGEGAPDFLTIGHVTRDVRPDGSFSLGGTVTFAALTAYRLGLVAAVVTCADEQLAAELPAHLPGIAIAVRQSKATTTFENLY